tara:strand:- start:12567 stop:13487 length:921 start_codon:yes stop_codon:yes gene_type:complete
MKNILITGASGFIGSALIKRIQLDKDLQKYKLFAVDKHNGEFEDSVEFIKMRVESNNFIDLVKDIAPAKCFHLAAQTSGYLSEKNPSIDIETNVSGVSNLCLALKDLPITEINFTSSMAIYGNMYNEYSGPETSPISVYGITKLSGEFLFKRLKNYGHKLRIFRLFNVYGLGQDLNNLDQGMLSIYIAQALKNAEIIVKGKKNRTRDFIHVDDVTSNLLKGFDELDEGTYDIGTGKEISVENLISLIIKYMELLKLNIPTVKYIDGFKEDVDFSRANPISKIENKIRLEDKIIEILKLSYEQIKNN